MQPTAPYLDAVSAYGFRGSTRFHVPGHKGGEGTDPGLRAALGDRALLLDVPQDIEGIDLGPTPTPYERAEELAAEAYGAARTWFLTNGATQGNHALCLALAGPDERVLVQRNSHASLIDGLILSGGRPAYVAPEYHAELGMALGVTPEALAQCLRRNADIRTAFIVSPTYYGMAADVARCAEVAHAAGVALVVDNAWGAHFGFHSALPASPLDLGADAMLTSTHKIIGSLTQSAMLHVAPDGLIDPGALERAVRLVRSTSQSSLLFASLDAARRQLAVHGDALLARTLAGAQRTSAAIDAIQGCQVLGGTLVGRPGVSGWDPLRLVVDVRGTGCTGYEIAAALRASYDTYTELATHASVVFVLGLAQPVEALERLAHDFTETVRRIARPGRLLELPRQPVGTDFETVMTPREAFLGSGEPLAVEDAVGRISCESIAGYPPGVPALLPGERVTAEVTQYLRDMFTAGARLHGAADPTFATVRVLASAPAAVRAATL
ncbi:MAG: aminotransferase class I/II-fold pyridoxal phosphate-dependent enzyme [Solirubrobacterales bacterium]|nr:aminotransferase class I/II-fold pyridoxal phosphate-dependent enzyme [Solirubrobacterales bacterium]MBV9167208.1 aminotransferase class I/II-fold pyridoxal phosphate-dependent enzyme [Solirubrobacterales bacterium]MBV9534760.1 aminotransferase class I/II-fold pyridoxal phosphate-dependent enzyme [Solirubrobacterales bacterium]